MYKRQVYVLNDLFLSGENNITAKNDIGIETHMAAIRGSSFVKAYLKRVSNNPEKINVFTNSLVFIY